MSGDTLKQATAAVLNPIGTAANAVGLGDNDAVKALNLATNPLIQAEAASNLLNFQEGSKLTSELTGSKLEADKSLAKAKKRAAGDMASDEALLGSARAAVDLMNPNSQQFTGQARTAGGQQELSRLLALFNQRQQDFAGSRARPGIQQTRLV